MNRLLAVIQLLFLVGPLCVARAEQSDGPSAHGDRSGELLLAFQTSRWFWVQCEVAKELIQLRDPKVIPQLTRYLLSSNRAERCNAGLVVAALGDDRGFDAIVAELKDTAPRPARDGRRRSNGTPDSDGQRRQDRYYAGHALGVLKDRRAVPLLVDLLADPEVNYTIPWALGEIGDPAAIEPLCETLSDQNPDMRALALRALAKLGARAAVPQMRPLMNDNERTRFDKQITVGEAASNAIAVLEKRPQQGAAPLPPAPRPGPEEGAR